MNLMLRIAQIVLILPFGLSSAFAESTDSAAPKLPNPLTLDYALSLADEVHPDLVLSDVKVQQSIANRQLIEAENGLNVKLDVGLYVTDEDSLQRLPAQDHARAGVIVSKDLYDFGYTSDRLNAAGQRVTAQQWQYSETRAQRRIDILRAYLNVLLADLQFSQYNEAMAIGYVNYDKAKKRKAVGTHHDLEILERQSEYQRLRVLRYQSENLQLSTRAKLAEALNRPNQLPENLETPKLDVLKRKLPEIEDLLQLALKNNFRIKSLQASVQAAESNLAAARNSNNPVINFNARMHEYETDAGAADELSAELKLSYDLYKPNKDAKVAAQLAELYKARAELSKAESLIRQDVLETWHLIEELSVKRESMAALLQYRELSLDKNRLLYEMEVKADLGYSMAELTEAQYLSRKNEYQLALAWYKLDLLTASVSLNDPPKQPGQIQSESKGK